VSVRQETVKETRDRECPVCGGPYEERKPVLGTGVTVTREGTWDQSCVAMSEDGDMLVVHLHREAGSQ